MRKSLVNKWAKIGLIVIAIFLSSGLFICTPSLGSSSGSSTVPGRFIVQVKPGYTPLEVAGRMAKMTQVKVGHVYRTALHGFSAQVGKNIKAEHIKALPGVLHVEPDRVMHAVGQTLPTGVDRIEADQNDTANIDGVDERVPITVAIIDTGIDLDHPDLNVNTELSAAFNSQGKKSPDDQDGHGTHVAGIVGALDNDFGVVGVAPGAELVSVRVLGPNGSGYLSDVIAGVDYVTQNADNIEVANMSLGGTGVSNSFRTAIQNSVNAGVIYVVAAGNDEADVYGSDGTFETDDDTIPAAYPEVATISAMADSNGEPGGTGADTSYGSDDSFAPFSNFSGSVVSENPVTSPGAAIDLLQPGVDIYSTYKGGGYTTMSGTSMSSPHAAGLAALYIAVNGRDTDGDGDHDSADVYDIRQALIDDGVAQDSADGLATLNDPDDNWENIGWASSAVGDPPTVSWVNPKDTDIVSGSVTIQIDASDTKDDTGTLTVEWRVDGASWQSASYDSGTGYYEDTWDSTGVPDDDHTLDARATDSDGNQATAGITVATENTDNAPTVSWVNPKDGDTVSGTITIQIDASDDRDSGSDLTVQWQVDDGTWNTATYDSTSEYYIASWDTTAVSDGDHNLDARATDTGSNTSSEQRITVTVNNTGGSTSDMYVSDISFSEKHYGRGGSKTDLRTTVTIWRDADADGTANTSGDEPVGNAHVYMTLTHDTDGDGEFTSDDDSWDFSGDTDSEGKVTFTLKFAPDGNYKAEVTDVTHGTYTYNSSLDADNPDYHTVGSSSTEESYSLQDKPQKSTLYQNYPNPFNPETTIEYNISEPGHVTLNIYNMAGELVKTLVDKHQGAGPHSITWYGDNDAGEEVASGVYFYQITVTVEGEIIFKSTKKMVVLK